MKIRILLVDDHNITRKGLRRLIESEADFEVVGEAEDGRRAVEAFETDKPDIVVMDIAMPVLNGVEATRRIRQIDSKARVVILSMHDDKEYVIRTLEAGAAGYLLKDCATEELLRAIKTVYEGKMYLSPDVSAGVVENLLLVERNQSDALDTVDLSPREIEVLQLIAEENSSKEIAEVLNISVRTVENHRRQIMTKLNVRSIAGLTKYAVKKGIVSL